MDARRFFFCFLRHRDRKILQRTLPFLGKRTVVLLPSWVRWVGAMISVSLIVFPFFWKLINWKVGKVWVNKGKMFSQSCSVTREAPPIYLALPGQRRRLGWLSLDILLLLNPKGLPPTSSSHSPTEQAPGLLHLISKASHKARHTTGPRHLLLVTESVTFLSCASYSPSLLL